MKDILLEIARYHQNFKFVTIKDKTTIYWQPRIYYSSENIESQFEDFLKKCNIHVDFHKYIPSDINFEDAVLNIIKLENVSVCAVYLCNACEFIGRDVVFQNKEIPPDILKNNCPVCGGDIFLKGDC